MVDRTLETWFTMTMTTNENAGQVIRQKAHAEFTTDNEILVMFADGEVRIFDGSQPEKVLRSVRARDRAQASSQKLAAVVTTLTWHNCPEGWSPPQ